MKEYHKINTVYKRTKDGRLMVGDWSQPEFAYLKDLEWIGTEKVDGTNVRVGWMAGFGVKIGGKTDEAQMPVFLMDRLRELFPPTLFESTISETSELTLYGEGYGAKVQKGGGNYKSDGVDFVLFDVRVGDWWLQRSDVEDVATKLGIKVVPIIHRGSLQTAILNTEVGFNSQWGSFAAEGMVLKPAVELQTRAGERIVTKIKHEDFARIAETK